MNGSPSIVRVFVASCLGEFTVLTIRVQPSISSTRSTCFTARVRLPNTALGGGDAHKAHSHRILHA